MELIFRISYCVIIGSLIFILHKWIGRYPDPFPKSGSPGKEIREVLLLWGMAVLIPVARMFAVTPWLSNLVHDRFLQELIQLPLLTIPYLLIPLYLVMIRGKWTLAETGLAWKVKSPGVALFAVTLGLVSGLTAWFSSQVVVSSDPIPAGALVLLLYNNDFLEELFHRGIIQSKLERALGQQKAILLGGILFGMTHIAFDIKMLLDTGVIYVIFAFILQTMLGWLLGIIYMKTRSLWPGVACHYLVNWLPSILQGIA